jgi:hypothetical protein
MGGPQGLVALLDILPNGVQVMIGPASVGVTSLAYFFDNRVFHANSANSAFNDENKPGLG